MILLLKQKSVNDEYVLIAGYHKPGETLEQCAIRETKEETNINVDSIEYIGSYYYEKKDTVMVAYHARSNSVEFELDETEVDDASWFSYNCVLEKVRKGSIGKEVLNKFLQTQ